MTEGEERAYQQGLRQAYLHMTGDALRHLERGPEFTNLVWERERLEVVMKMREICEYHGDNDWTDNINLADVLERHLMNHLEENSIANQVRSMAEAEEQAARQNANQNLLRSAQTNSTRAEAFREVLALLEPEGEES